jgi:hypothetical protein
MTTKPHYRRFYKEFCIQMMNASKTMGEQEVLNHKRRKEKQSESSIVSAAHINP